MNSDIRGMGLKSMEAAVEYGLLNTLGGLPATLSCKQTAKADVRGDIDNNKGEGAANSPNNKLTGASVAVNVSLLK